MSTCPKCQKKLRVFDIGQKCPHCGVNMRFYDFDKKFIHEAKKAELSMANVHVCLRKFKTAMIGSKLAIARLVLGFMPVVAMLLPVGIFKLNVPFAAQEIQLSALGIYNSFSNGALNFLLSMMSSPVNGASFTHAVITVGVYALSVLCAVLGAVFTILNFISMKKMPRAICSFCLIGIAAGIAATVLVAVFPSSILISGSASFGVVAIILLFSVVFAVNFIIARKGLEIHYEEGDYERYEIRKKVLRGEIRIEDLPQPIVETAATRAIDEEILKEQRKYAEMTGEKEEVQQ